MDAGAILGALLGNKGKSGGSNILGDILGGVLGGKKEASQPARTSSSSSRSSGGGLEDLLKTAYSKYTSRSGECNDADHARYEQPARQASELDNEQAVILIRAMINAAKADGRLDQSEQDAIVKQLGTLTQEEVDFLNKEFRAPLNVREFAWSVPLGLEENVYGLSLMAIKLDENKEATYLKDLAHGLRIKPADANEIHQRFRAPTIFRT